MGRFLLREPVERPQHVCSRVHVPDPPAVTCFGLVDTICGPFLVLPTGREPKDRRGHSRTKRHGRSSRVERLPLNLAVATEVPRTEARATRRQPLHAARYSLSAARPSIGEGNRPRRARLVQAPPVPVLVPSADEKEDGHLEARTPSSHSPAQERHSELRRCSATLCTPSCKSDAPNAGMYFSQ